MVNQSALRPNHDHISPHSSCTPTKISTQHIQTLLPSAIASACIATRTHHTGVHHSHPLRYTHIKLYYQTRLDTSFVYTTLFDSAHAQFTRTRRQTPSVHLVACSSRGPGRLSFFRTFSFYTGPYGVWWIWRIFPFLRALRYHHVFTFPHSGLFSEDSN
jgi:hypothetical protein